MVIAHTRELAFQISKEYERFSKYLDGIKTKVVYGGISISQDKEYFKKEMPNILVYISIIIYRLVHQAD